MHVPAHGTVVLLPNCGVSPYWISTALPFQAGGSEIGIEMIRETTGLAGDVMNSAVSEKELQSALM